MKPRVELIYDMDCPNVGEARAVLLKAFVHANVQPSWSEMDRKAADSPAYARSYGSPTILINGRDVAGASSAEPADCCRLYPQANGYQGVPALPHVVEALNHARNRSSAGFRWSEFFATLPGVLVAVVPVAHCPACWPAYGAILGALGLGFLFNAEYLLPITLAVLGACLFALGYRAHYRHGWRPLALGVAASALILIGKFVVTSDPALYVGLTLLVLASIWNALSRKEKDYAKN